MRTSNGDLLNPENDNTERQDTIFDDVADLSMYEKRLNSTRNWIYVVAGLWALWGFVSYHIAYDKNIALFILSLYLAVGIVFLILGLWSRKKPALAFLITIMFYILVNALLMYFSYTFSVQTVIIRIIIIISVIRGYFTAREYEELKKTLNFSTKED